MALGKKTGGRKRGTPNKLTATVKDSILAAFDEVGGTAYLVDMAREYPVAFMTLIGKVLPIQAELSGPGGGSLVPPVLNIVIGSEPENPDAAP